MPPYPPIISSTVSTYLNQWLKLASGGRVVLHQHTNGGYQSFTVFKCKTCGDNWHVGDENFKGTGIPEVLQDWVKKHRHVCTKYTNPDVHHGICKMCGWPFGAHEQAWLKDAPAWAPVIPITSGQKPVKYWTGTNVPTTEPAPKGNPAYKELPLPIFKGRKFRDSDEGIS